MSKPISFGFGKSKTNSTPTLQPTAQLPTTRPSVPKAKTSVLSKPVKAALRDESDDEDESTPKHELVTGFSTTGAILSRPKQEQQDKVIQNSGNGDWRRRGRKNLLPSEVQAQNEAQRNGDSVITTERNEVSSASGLQYASTTDNSNDRKMANGGGDESTSQAPEREMTEDERALAALLDDGTGRPKSNTIIATQGNARLQQRDEVADFREDVATRPESATLDEYAAMPVEEFGMAMLRGMGQKRKANGEVIDLGGSKTDDKTTKQRKQEGFLGIGAKPAPGIQGVELGAWGKADMRKNNRGEGFFTPVMIEDKRTGERITEEELERRKREAKESKSKKQNGDDWRERRERNLEQNGRDLEANGSRKRDRDYEGSRSGRDRDRDRNRQRDRERGPDTDRRKNRGTDDGDYDSSRSRRDKDRSRSTERWRRDDNDSDEYRKRDKHRDRDRDRYRDDDRYESSSSRKSHRDQDHRDDRRHREHR